jgi:hypothetical protein
MNKPQKAVSKKSTNNNTHTCAFCESILQNISIEGVELTENDYRHIHNILTKIDDNLKKDKIFIKNIARILGASANSLRTDNVAEHERHLGQTVYNKNCCNNQPDLECKLNKSIVALNEVGNLFDTLAATITTCPINYEDIDNILTKIAKYCKFAHGSSCCNGSSCLLRHI